MAHLLSGRPFAVLLASAFFAGATSLATAQFSDQTAAAGLDQEFYSVGSGHGLGLSWVDVNNDGWVDLFAVNGKGQETNLYLNNGDGTFTKRNDLLPVLPDVEKTGSVFADYDNDGDQDIFITTDNDQFDLSGPNETHGPANILLRNNFVENGNQILNGQPLFNDVAVQAGVAEPAPSPGTNYDYYRSMTAAFLDHDRDGWVDLFVGHMVLQAAGDPMNQNKLYHNNGDGTFTEVTQGVGLPGPNDTQYNQPTLACIAADLNGDLWPDLYWVNVHEPMPQNNDVLWLNNGDGTFTDATALSPGLGDDSGSGMGIHVGDVDNDGDWDIYISDLWDSGNDALPLGNPYYESNGDGTWMDNTADIAGIQGDSSWGVNFFDIDQDGWLDLTVATMSNDPTLAYRNRRDKTTFTDVTNLAGMGTINNGRGSQVADYDGDGDLDLVIVNQSGPLQLYRNDTLGGNYLKVKLVATQSNRSAIGAQVRIRTGALRQMRQVTAGDSAHGQSQLDVHFGVGNRNVVNSVFVLWPSGERQVFTNVPANSTLTVVEP